MAEPGIDESADDVLKRGAEDEPPVSATRGLRHLLAFQFKLAMDAVRDFALSPVSIVAFLIDAVRKPPANRSLYRALMRLGRRSDRIINLFDEYSDSDHYTVDETLTEVERALWREFKKEQARRMEKQSAVDDGGPRADSQSR